MSLSVVINTKNAEKTLRPALRSVNFADEIVVVDMMSTDDTVKIASRFTEDIYPYKRELGYADPARNFALSKASGNWILVLDADEEITPDLRRFIEEVTLQENNQVDCYYIPRKNLIFNKWMQHTGWWPDYQPRLFKKGKVEWQVGVHRLPDVKGESVYLDPKENLAIVHHNYPSVSEYIERLNRYTSVQAKERSAEKASPAKLSSTDMLNTFSQQFASRFFAHEGYKDGAHGTALALLQAMYELTVSLKQWEEQEFQAGTESPAKTQQALEVFQANLNYWIADWRVKNSSGLAKFYWQIRRKLKI